jgi:hypothetical protein
MPQTPKAPGQAAFESYNAAGDNPGLTWDKKPVPTWPDLSDDVRAKWAAAEKAAGRVRLEAFPPIATLHDPILLNAFARAQKRYSTECILHNAPLPTPIFLECFEDELSKLPPR